MGKISEEVGSVFRIWDMGYRKQSISYLRYPISSHPVGESGRSWIRTSEGVSQQIYSLPRLATSVSARKGKDSQKRRVRSKTIPRKNMASRGR